MDIDLTRAECGVRIFDTLTTLFHESVKGKSAAEALVLRECYTAAVTLLVQSTGVRLSLPSAVVSMTTDERAVTLASAIRRAHEFVTAQTQSAKYEIRIPKARSSKKNLIDHCTYEHLATVYVEDGRELVFAISELGQYVLCPESYWAMP